MRTKLLLLLFVVFSVTPTADGKTFTFHDGDRIVFLGNSFFERAIDAGCIEAMLTLAWPEYKLTFRNLGWDGDTIYGHSRAGGRRRAVFGDVEEGFQRMVEHVNSLSPSIVVLAYGYNESFAGDEGLDRFTRGLVRLTSEIGDAKTRFVLLSPIRVQLPSSKTSVLDAKLQEHLTKRNDQLERYVSALQSFANSKGHRFVDLFHDDGLHNGLSEDGIHPTESGYRRIAKVVERQLDLPASKFWSLEEKAKVQLREAIVHKNTLYFHRWRPRNDAFVYGERKSEQEIAQQEPEQLEPFISQQEQRIRKLIDGIGGAAQ